MRKILIIGRRAPYGSIFTVEGLLAAMAMTSMDLPTDLVLVDDGVYCAFKKQGPDGIGHQSIQNALEGASEFDVNLYVSESSVQERKIDRAKLISAKFVNDEALTRMVKEADAIMTF